MQTSLIGQNLVDKNAISKSDLVLALSVKHNNPQVKLGEILREYNFVSEVDMAKYLAAQYGYVYCEDLTQADIDLINILSLEECMDYGILPLIKDPEQVNRQKIVIADPSNPQVFSFVEQRLRNGSFEFMVGREDIIRLTLQELSLKNSLSYQQNYSDEINLKEVVQNCIYRAVRKGATDIHCVPDQYGMNILFRIKGVNKFDSSVAKQYSHGIFNVICHLCELDASQSGKFFDGSMKVCVDRESINIRVSIIPASYGNAICLRILDRGRTLLSLEGLGFDSKTNDKIKKLISKSSGLNLVIGPTGSGKSTTLYAILNQIKSISKTILSIEDPVEIKQSMLAQVSVNAHKGISFLSAARAFLRHDPDVIFIGEVRDDETAREAVNAALTGHQVFSTFHAKDVLSAVVRLKRYVKDGSEIALGLNGIIAQRLFRKLCPHCRIKLNMESGYRAGQCSRCGDGYSGIIVLAEVLSIDRDLREIIEQGSSVMFVRQHLEQKGHKFLSDIIWDHIKCGIISFNDASGEVDV